ncbi:MAG TPA: vitamin K epoxide reductase family protein [Chryseolinea sp.]
MNSGSSTIPPAWDYNPSAWSQRWPLIAIAMVGFFIALYLGLYQVDVVSSVWDPFFADGSKRVLNSPVSKALPVPDALLGAFSYFLDAVTGVIGGVQRWRTKPWIVVLFGIATGPLGLTSVLLVILQPVVVGAWCTLCLVTAVISIVMISPAMDEVLASLQYLQRVQRRGYSLWDAFWGRHLENLKVQ